MTPPSFSTVRTTSLRQLVFSLAALWVASSPAHAQLRILDYNVGATGTSTFGPRPGMDAVLQAINAQTNSPRDALARLETLVMMAGFDLPLRAIREQIASAIRIVVQADRQKDGSRKVSTISEIIKMEGEIITMQDLFVFKQEGWSPAGKIIGKHVGCGNIPSFMEEIQRARLELDISIFADGRGDYR